MFTAIKVLLTAVLVVAASEAAKRSTALGAILASLPLTSLLAFMWVYVETGDTVKIAALSRSIIWYVLPSIVLFIALPVLLERGVAFWPSLAIATVMTVIAYGVMLAILPRFGISL